MAGDKGSGRDTRNHDALSEFDFELFLRVAICYPLLPLVSASVLVVKHEPSVSSDRLVKFEFDTPGINSDRAAVTMKTALVSNRRFLSCFLDHTEKNSVLL